MIGVERRYKVKAAIISKWLDDYRQRLMKEAFDIVNGTYIYFKLWSCLLSPLFYNVDRMSADSEQH